MNPPDSTRDVSDPDADLVTVFETTEAALLPLAQAALEEAGIESATENRGLNDEILGARSSRTVGETDTPLLIVVRAEDAARAREVLSELTTGSTSAMPATPPTAAGRSTVASNVDSLAGDVELTDAESGVRLGHLTPSQFASLASHLELESTHDDDYYIDAATVSMLEDKQADPAAIAVLRQALGNRTDVTVRWRRQPTR
jgi:processive 1,2-diacylglycerol beta-glucosyltransferase